MREDKLIRPAAATEHGALLALAQRAAQKGDQDTLAKIVDMLGGMAEIARTTRDRTFIAGCGDLSRKLARIVRNPSAGGLVLETKHAAQVRPKFDDSFEVDAVKRGAVAGTITGYGSTFGNVDYGGDVVMPGAFATSLRDWKVQGRLPVMLAQHDSGSFPIGVWTSMREDSVGLRVEGKIAATARGAEAWALITMDPPALDAMSIGFRLVDSEVSRNGDRLLKEIELWEISLVGLPMNPKARIDRPKAIDAIDARMRATLQELRAVIEREEASERSNVIQFPSRTDDITDADERALLDSLRRLNQTLRA